MGDNRTDSEDSRYFGPIAASLIVGQDGLRRVAVQRRDLDRDPVGAAAWWCWWR